jgi:hypothetical protein
MIRNATASRAMIATLIVGCGRPAGLVGDAAGEAPIAADAPADTSADAPPDTNPDSPVVDARVDASPDAPIDASTVDAFIATVDVGSTGCPNSFATAEIFSGPITIASALDVQALHDIRAITGTVTITLPDVTLPNLSYVGGDIGPTGNGSLVAPSLCYVNGNAYIDAAQSDLSGLRQVRHRLQLGTNGTSVSLPSLQQVGNLDLGGPQLTTISFPSLRTIDDEMVIGSQFELNGIAIANMSGFSALSSVNGITIGGASNLSDFTGLENVHSLRAGLVIKNAPNLLSLRGLGLTPGRMQQISFDTVPALTDISPLANVTSIGTAGLNITGAFNLTNIDALSAIPQIDGPINFYADKRLAQIRFDALTTAAELTVNTNRALTSVSMANVTTIAGRFYITGNDVLTSISFPALTSIGDLANVSANPLLPTCQATKLAAQLTIPPPNGFWIAGNGSGTCP